MPFFLVILTNPVQPSVAFLYPLKPSENLWIKFCKRTSLNAAIKVISYYVTSVQIRSFIIQSECGKIRTRKNSVFGDFTWYDITLIAGKCGLCVIFFKEVFSQNFIHRFFDVFREYRKATPVCSGLNMFQGKRMKMQQIKSSFTWTTNSH